MVICIVEAECTQRNTKLASVRICTYKPVYDLHKWDNFIPIIIVYNGNSTSEYSGQIE